LRYRIVLSTKDREMDNMTFGVTMLVVGMGGTLLTLWGISLVIRVLKRMFPVKEDKTTD
jgi:hypothetical protein